MKRSKFFFVITLVLILLAILFFSLLLSIRTIYESNEKYSLLEIKQQHFTYLPIVKKEIIKKPIIGIEVEDSNGLELEPYYHGAIQKIAICWADVEISPGVYDWSKIDYKIIPGARLLINIKCSVPWSNSSPSRCMLPDDDYVSDYIGFVKLVIERYNPDYIEIWNEPDTQRELTGGIDLYLGCLGTDYAAGKEYAEFFNKVYPVIKSAHPNVQILSGALMNVYQYFTFGMIENLIETDGISFHNYDWCGDESKLPGKVDFLWNETDEPLFLTETGITFADSTSMKCLMNQVEYYILVMDQEKLEMAIWYTLGCRDWMWKNTDMILCNPLVLRPVYFTYRDR